MLLFKEYHSAATLANNLLILLQNYPNISPED